MCGGVGKDMALSGLKLTWVLMRALCTLSASYSRAGKRRQRKGHGALCGRHEHWLPSPHLPQTHTHTHSLQPVHGLCRGGAGAWTVCPKKHLLGSKRIH